MTEKPIALITGGAQGIGFACAEAIEADGARIVLADVNDRGVIVVVIVAVPCGGNNCKESVVRSVPHCRR